MKELNVTERLQPATGQQTLLTFARHRHDLSLCARTRQGQEYFQHTKRPATASLEDLSSSQR